MVETEPAGLSDARLAAIEARCAAAAPGPWVAWAGQGWSKAWAEHWGLDPGVGTVWPIAPEGVTGPNGHPEPDQWLLTTTEPAVQTFVAHARADVPDLLAEVRRLRAALEEYGRHNEGCSAAFGPAYRCRCGWRDDAKALGITEGWPAEAPRK